MSATGEERAGGPAAAAKGPEPAIPRLPLLLEVGSEELPARFLPPIQVELRERLTAMLADEGLDHDPLLILATPRRLAVLCEGLATRQPDRNLEIKGPPLARAFDAAGRPTGAAEGFARKNGVRVENCLRLADERGEYLAVRKVVPGLPAVEVLAAKLPRLLLELPFPKVMRWGTGQVLYARPLQWLVALLGQEIVPLQLGELPAGNQSRGHRTLAQDRPVIISSPSSYLDILRANGVLVDPTERRRKIEAGIATGLASLAVAATWRADAELMEEVLYLCEYPTPLIGEFSEEFFALPAEVIVTALKAHQRYFAVIDRDSGGLLPCFIAVRDGGDHALDSVRRGNERVLRARLADALFYWQFDQQRTPDQQRDQLAHVTWIEGFGSVLEKTRRLEQLVGHLWTAGFGNGQDVPPDALRAAALCKTDLVSEMIKDGKEFTRLEGIIGARYAQRAGENDRVCRAIERHYLPRGAQDELPGDPISSVLAAADRLDNLAGCWLAGLLPTGAKDPYGLRRHALALLRIILDGQVRTRLTRLVEQALTLVGVFVPDHDLGPPAQELHDFILTRLAGHLVDNLGLEGAVVRAILPAHGDDPADAVAWARALAGFRHQTDFLQLATGFKRCRNILEGHVHSGPELLDTAVRWLAGGRTPDGQTFAALTEPAEQELANQLLYGASGLLEDERKGDYVAVFRRLSRFGPAIDEFFASVRVNAEDIEMRRLRHAFLREIHGLFARYADFSEIAPVES